ncbi:MULTISPECIES: phosphoheptose isomerase [unclassified Siphonobacter]|uniref:phosphoheptose isomerase n=1 Tax=unclassified Siphonobacter TaxID=2635712 RepID=UPI000CB8936E|nr:MULTISPECIES: phosphoheptose isomerase [unclassified Siphonobacter]MDQ1088005.1 mannose-6-phosphate isomerase [Siphonobacter sp. SORGH_AS_1065]MDR6194155.1 mannose-6-phosphate isomerase [Siphonobacter sp. SORGH_AS_0500]PKK36955.1 phosphoheptose isomerase [Siphonobacter sp. SORGH_AS_0500]
MNLSFSAETSKAELFDKIAAELASHGLTIATQDQTRPWGGFFVIDEAQTEQFVSTYFPMVQMEDLKGFAKLSPKILVVGPEKRLSWQYHFRRAEIWRVVAGTVAVMTSPTDEEGETRSYEPGELITLQQGERHRLIGLENWGIVAEIWQHTDPTNPSDEDDIVRVQDDFQRK